MKTIKRQHPIYLLLSVASVVLVGPSMAVAAIPLDISGRLSYEKQASEIEGLTQSLIYVEDCDPVNDPSSCRDS